MIDPRQGELPFQEPTGAELRDAGVSAVLDADEAVHRGHRDRIELALDELIVSGVEFCADDLRERLDEDTLHHCSPNLVSAVIAVAARQGRVQQTGWTTSARPARHHGALRTWVGQPATPTTAA